MTAPILCIGALAALTAACAASPQPRAANMVAGAGAQDAIAAAKRLSSEQLAEQNTRLAFAPAPEPGRAPALLRAEYTPAGYTLREQFDTWNAEEGAALLLAAAADSGRPAPALFN